MLLLSSDGFQREARAEKSTEMIVFRLIPYIPITRLGPLGFPVVIDVMVSTYVGVYRMKVLCMHDWPQGEVLSPDRRFK